MVIILAEYLGNDSSAARVKLAALASMTTLSPFGGDLGHGSSF
jgi:hypothetical protein